MKSLIFGCLLALAPLKDKDYCNARFDFCITYPANFKAEGESTNGDGQTFTSNDSKATITTWGELFSDEEIQSLEKNYQYFAKDFKVVYKVKKADYFIASGTDKAGNIVYQKTVLKKVNYFGTEANTKVFQTVRIVYPASQQTQYASYCSYIAKAL